MQKLPNNNNNNNNGLSPTAKFVSYSKQILTMYLIKWNAFYNFLKYIEVIESEIRLLINSSILFETKKATCFQKCYIQFLSFTE